jgi:hypothetical protein
MAPQRWELPCGATGHGCWLSTADAAPTSCAAAASEARTLEEPPSSSPRPQQTPRTKAMHTLLGSMEAAKGELSSLSAREALHRGQLLTSRDDSQALTAEQQGVAAPQRYVLEVVTADVKWAGTDARVTVELHGERASSGALALGPQRWRDNFARGSTDTFELLLPAGAPELGALRRLSVQHDGEGFGAGWLLEQITVHRMRPDAAAAAAEVTRFPCGRWLDQRKDDGRTRRELTPAAEDEATETPVPPPTPPPPPPGMGTPATAARPAAAAAAEADTSVGSSIIGDEWPDISRPSVTPTRYRVVVHFSLAPPVLSRGSVAAEAAWLEVVLRGQGQGQGQRGARSAPLRMSPAECTHGCCQGHGQRGVGVQCEEEEARQLFLLADADPSGRVAWAELRAALSADDGDADGDADGAGGGGGGGSGQFSPGSWAARTFELPLDLGELRVHSAPAPPPPPPAAPAPTRS